MAESSQTSDMRLVVIGAAGRMGRTLVRTIQATPGTALAAAIEAPGSAALGQDAGLLAGCGALGVPVTDDPLTAFVAADGVIDFSVPAATVALAAEPPASGRPTSRPSTPRPGMRPSCARAT